MPCRRHPAPPGLALREPPPRRPLPRLPPAEPRGLELRYPRPRQAVPGRRVERGLPVHEARSREKAVGQRPLDLDRALLEVDVAPAQRNELATAPPGERGGREEERTRPAPKQRPV